MTRPEALVWFVDLCERLDLKKRNGFAEGGSARVGTIRVRAFHKGWITKEQMLDSADHLQGDADAHKTYREAKKELGLTKQTF